MVNEEQLKGEKEERQEITLHSSYWVPGPPSPPPGVEGLLYVPSNGGYTFCQALVSCPLGNEAPQIHPSPPPPTHACLSNPPGLFLHV